MNKNLAIAVLVFLLAGCGYYNTFYNARRAYEKKQYDVAQKKCESILSKKSQQWLHDDALYLQGLISFEQQKYTEALYYFEKIHTDFSDSNMVNLSRKKIIEIYFLQQQFSKAYNYIKTQFEKDPSRENVDFYARILYLLGYEKELEGFVRQYTVSSQQGVRYWAYYFHLTKQTSKLTHLISEIKEIPFQQQIVEELYFTSFDLLLWEKYLKNNNSFNPYAILYMKTVDISDVDLFLSNKTVGNERKIAVLEKVLESCVVNENFLVAKYAIIKLKNLQSGNSTSDESNGANVQFSISIDQLFDQPSDWQHVFTNGTFFYLITDKQEVYKVVKRKWERQPTLNTPPKLEADTFTYWDAMFQRWIFFAPNSQERRLNVLYFADMQWDTIRLDNNSLPLFSQDSFYLFQNNAYIFYSSNRIMKLSFEKDRVVADLIEISGYIPPITGYVTLYLPPKGMLILIGGKMGEADNPLAYSLSLHSEIPQWKECFSSVSLDWNSYTVKTLLSSTGTLLTFWKSEIQTQTGNKELFKSYSVGFIDGMVEIKENMTPLKMPVETLEYTLLNHRYIPLIYFYKDTKTNFSNIKFIRTSLSFVSTNIQKTDESTTTITTALSKAKTIDYDATLSIIEHLAQLIAATPRDDRKIGDIYLYDLKMPQKALQLYLKEYESSKSPLLLYGIGYIYYYYLQNNSKAKEYWEMFLQTDYDDILLRQRAEEFLKIIKKN